MPSTQPSTPAERVRQALRREQPTETPFTWGFGPNAGTRRKLLAHFEPQGIDWDILRRETEDVVSVYPDYIGDRVPEGTPDYMGIWGIRTKSVDYGEDRYDDEIAFNPLAETEDPQAYDDYEWPQVEEFDYQVIAAQLAQNDPEGHRALRLGGGNPFEIYCWMTGMEEAMMNLVAEPELVEVGLMHINRFFKAHLEKTIEALPAGRRVDLVQIADDLGMQSGPLISGESYRSVIQPFHRDLCEHIRHLLPGAVISHHSDGSVFRLLPDLLDAGVQMLEAVQVECADMDPRKLADAFGDRLMFQGAISVQQLLPHATPGQVRTAVRDLISILGQNGGYLPAPSHAIQVGTPPENILAMLEEVLGEERFAAAIEAARQK